MYSETSVALKQGKYNGIKKRRTVLRPPRKKQIYGFSERGRPARVPNLVSGLEKVKVLVFRQNKIIRQSSKQ